MVHDRHGRFCVQDDFTRRAVSDGIDCIYVLTVIATTRVVEPRLGRSALATRTAAQRLPAAMEPGASGRSSRLLEMLEELSNTCL